MDKKFSAEELKKDLELKDDAAGVEIPEDLLDAVAGGITQEEWNKLSKDEQDLLRMESMLLLGKGMHCSLLDD